MKFERTGNGPPLVLIPGLACDRGLWSFVEERLARGFTLIFPHTWGQESLNDTAHEVSGILSDLGDTPVGVAGLSMGGYIVFELLRHWPQGVRAAAILDSTAFPDAPERVEKRQQMLRLLAEHRFEDVLTGLASSVLAPQHGQDGPARDLLLTMGRALGAEGFERDVEAILYRGSFEDVLRSVRVPLLFVVGEHDSLTPPDLARRMAAQVPGSRVEVIADAGHMTPLENPSRVAEVLETFFRRALYV